MKDNEMIFFQIFAIAGGIVFFIVGIVMAIVNSYLNDEDTHGV